MRRAALEVSEAAARRLKRLLKNHPEALGIRIGLKTRGCNGLSYVMNYATERKKFEEEVTCGDGGGVRVLIDPRAMLHVVGTRMDYVDDELTSEFVFHNPNAKGMCGCGESFNV